MIMNKKMWKQSAFFSVYGSIWGVLGISAQIHGSENNKYIFYRRVFVAQIFFCPKNNEGKQ